MKKVLLLSILSLSILPTLAQPAGMLNETFKLKSIETDHLYFTPNGENANFTIYELPGSYVVETDGIFNTLNAAASFNGNLLTLNDYAITLHDCVEPNCYYEHIYFYDILSTQNTQSKTLTYYFNEQNGFKYLTLKDANNNWAHFSTEPAPVPNPLLFQTWYLFMEEVDLEDPIYYSGPDTPQLTIQENLSYTGVEACALISGDFILGNGDDYYDFLLQSKNYQTDESNCQPGQAEYILNDLEADFPLNSIISLNNDGVYILSYETFAGYIKHFQNQPLSTPKNSFSNILIFPNPVNNILILQSSEHIINSVSITDINGRIIKNIKAATSNEIDVSALKTGMYFIRISTSEGITTKKFTKN